MRTYRGCEADIDPCQLLGPLINDEDETLCESVETSLPPHVERALMTSLSVLHTLHGEITALEAILHQEAQLRPEFEILKDAFTNARRLSACPLSR
jgi:hypothetical protein